MAKHGAGSDEESPHRKRQRITKTPLPQNQNQTSKIQDVRDLQLLLAFEQDTGPHVRQKIQTFKSFLDNIAYGKDSNEQTSMRAMLLEYLKLQSSAGTEGYLADIIKTWHLATQTNVDYLYSSVTAVLALFLKTISGSIEFRDFGNQLCKSLLQDNQVRLFDKGLSASKSKEYLISPCLRLLTEIVTFDGGRAARAVFRHREITFKRLEVFLGMRRPSHGGGAETQRKPSVRGNALRFLYANLRLQTPSAKMNLLAQGKVLRALLEDVLEDAPNVVLSLVDVLKKDVALDKTLSQAAKGRIFNKWTLSHLATLCDYEETENISEQRETVQNSIHKFFSLVCTSPDYGVLDKFEQEFPPAKHEELYGAPKLSYSRILDDTRPRDEGKTSRLVSFLQSLRPYASTLQSELICAVFEKAPGLVSEYFSGIRSFSFDPKPTATWTGYCSFMLTTARLPLPKEFIVLRTSGGIPPPSHTIIDCIMPLPLTKKAMTRCLNQSINLIKYLSTRVLTAVFEKFGEMLEICKMRPKHSALAPDSRWGQLYSDLEIEFSNRIPDIEHIITQLRNCPKSNALLHESFTHLVALYCKILPQVALEANLDVSLALSDALTESPEDDSIRQLELTHLLEIAKRSPGMQWWHKLETMKFSPFTTLLKLHLEHSQNNSKSEQLKAVIASVIEESQILHFDESTLALDTLILSLQRNANWSPSSAVFEFLDNCILRLVRKTVHYFDLYSNLVTTKESGLLVTDSQIDLLLVVIVEQWPFLLKSTDTSTLMNVVMWLVRYIELSGLRIEQAFSGQDDDGPMKLLELLRDQVRSDVEDKTCSSMLTKSLSHSAELSISMRSNRSANIDEDGDHFPVSCQIDEGLSKPCLDPLPPGPPQEEDDHDGLNRWLREEIPDAIADGAIEDLFLCLCSGYVEIRQQAVTNVIAFMTKLEASEYSARQQSYLIAGELVETARVTNSVSALQSLAAALAAGLLTVVADPLHFMYEKVNRFLHKGALWKVTKLPSYWVDKIMLKPPTGDETHYQEVEWLLDILIDGLRTPADFELYRSSSIFEKVLSFAASPLVPTDCFQKILDLLFRCTYVDGSSTLIARCGLAGWILSRLSLHNGDGAMRARLKTLGMRIHETSDQERIDQWSDDSFHVLLDVIRSSKNE